MNSGRGSKTEIYSSTGIPPPVSATATEAITIGPCRSSGSKICLLWGGHSPGSITGFVPHKGNSVLTLCQSKVELKKAAAYFPDKTFLKKMGT